MYKPAFGSKRQLQFDNESDYYKFLGFLAKNDGTTRLVWEKNDEQGAWGQEGRIHFFTQVPNELNVRLLLTAGLGDIVNRVNCNDFINHIRQNHNFVLGSDQDQESIRSTVPSEFEDDFNEGLGL